MRVMFRNLGVALALTTLVILVNHLLGFNLQRNEIAVTVVLWCSIFLTIVQMRTVNASEHNFIVAFRNGFLYSVFYSGAYALLMAFYQHVVNPQFYPAYRESFEKKLIEGKIAPEMLVAKMRQFDMSYNGEFPSYILLFLFMGMGGVILSAIAAALYRKPKPRA